MFVYRFPAVQGLRVKGFRFRKSVHLDSTGSEGWTS